MHCGLQTCATEIPIQVSLNARQMETNVAVMFFGTFLNIVSHRKKPRRFGLLKTNHPKIITDLPHCRLLTKARVT